MEKTDKYLGNQLLLPSSRISSFDCLIEKCKLKLSSWKANTLSHAGRSILLKSSLASIPIYAMGTTVLPKGVIHKLTQIQRSFWWGSTKDHKKQCYISWEKITKPKQEGGLGVRRIEQVNLSLMSKLVWRFLTNPESMWGKLLQAKYLRNQAFWDVSQSYNSSSLWRNLIQCREFMKTGVCWIIAYGRKTHIWNDPWIPTIPGFRAIKRQDSGLSVTRVSELLQNNASQWNINLVHSLFVPHVANAVLHIPLSNTDDDDKLVWMPAKNGEFSSKSMYQHLLNDLPSGSRIPSHGQGFEWAKLWKITGVSPRIIMFIWRVIHNGLAVGNVLKKMYGGDGFCSFCQGQVETVEHCLFQCPRAAAVWDVSSIILPQAHNSLTISKVISLWMKKDIDCLRRGCAILWVLWKARNDWVFSSKISSPEVLLHSAEVLFQEYKLPPEPSTLHLQQCPSIINQHWLLPSQSCVKINFDGACLNGSIAAAAVARDANGAFLGCITKAQEFGNPILAEAHGCILAIDLIHRLQLSQVQIEGDSKVLIDNINSDLDCADWRITPMVRACRRIASARNDISFHFSPRSTNKVAHALASFAITYHVTQFWSGGLPPPFLLYHLFHDLASTVTPSVDE